MVGSATGPMTRTSQAKKAQQSTRRIIRRLCLAPHCRAGGVAVGIITAQVWIPQPQPIEELAKGLADLNEEAKLEVALRCVVGVPIWRVTQGPDSSLCR